jgi:mRNA-degrading endonuclease RelE of RelBE toxin-antitoxin system
MMHSATTSFWELYEKLPPSIQELAGKKFDLLKKDPSHPSLHLKKVGKYWSVRVGIKYRALGVEMEDGILWFWIGRHSEYDKLVG